MPRLLPPSANAARLACLAALVLAAPIAHAQARYVRVVSNAPEAVVWAEGPGQASAPLGAPGAVWPLPSWATAVRLVAPPYALSAPLPTHRDTALVRLDVPVEHAGIPALRGAPVRFRRGRTWVDAAALGVALAGTAVSVHYKFQADRRFADYERTGVPLLRPDIEALDDRAAVAFGVGMTGLALFTWRLAIR